MTAADFELLDNGVAQEITDVSYEKTADRRHGPPRRQRERHRDRSSTSCAASLRQLRADLGARDRLRLITFDMRIRRLVDFADPPSATDTALASLGASGSSAVFDSLAVALTAAVAARPAAADRALQRRTGQQQHQRRRNPARRRQAQHADRRRRAGVVLDASGRRRCCATRPNWARRRSAAWPIRLPAIPAASWSRINPGDNLTSTFRRVLEQFRTSYVLYFTPKGVDRQGTHTLEVRVKGAKVEVRARRGYVWR